MSIVADLVTTNDLLNEKIRHLKAGRSLRWWRSKRDSASDRHSFESLRVPLVALGVVATDKDGFFRTL